MRGHTSRPLLASCGSSPTTLPFSFLARAVPTHAVVLRSSTGLAPGLHIPALPGMEYFSPFSVFPPQLPVSTTIIPSNFSDLRLVVVTSKNPFITPIHPHFHLQSRL